MLGLYVLGILIGILAALIMNKTAFRGKPVPFVMELPNYRMPGLKSVALLLWEKAKDFLQRAFTVIFLATIIIWFLQSFDTRLNVVADSANSLLALIGQFIAPVFRPLGFGDWRCATALISGFIAKESVVSTLQVLLGGAAISSLLTTRSAISFLVFTLLYTPCVAAAANWIPGSRRSASWFCSAQWHGSWRLPRMRSRGWCDAADRLSPAGHRGRVRRHRVARLVPRHEKGRLLRQRLHR